MTALWLVVWAAWQAVCVQIALDQGPGGRLGWWLVGLCPAAFGAAAVLARFQLRTRKADHDWGPWLRDWRNGVGYRSACRDPRCGAERICWDPARTP